MYLLKKLNYYLKPFHKEILLKFQYSPNQNRRRFCACVEIDKLIPKCMWKCKRPRVTKYHVEKEK